MGKRLRAIIISAAMVAAFSSCGLDPGTGPRTTVDQGNFDPSALSDAAISKAAGLKVYFEHASVGSNVCDGIASLAAQPLSRYVSGRASGDATAAAAWFASHAGLVDNPRGNPGADAKVSLFVSSMSGSLVGVVDVAMFKFCYIDSPSTGTSAAFFASVKAAMEGLEAAHPGVTFVWWTMPIETSAVGERQAFNDAIRAYCADRGKWLLDIAALESHDDSGKAVVDVSGLELLHAGYTTDGGHLSPAGQAKLAKAYWSLLAGIAASR